MSAAGKTMREREAVNRGVELAAAWHDAEAAKWDAAAERKEDQGEEWPAIEASLAATSHRRYAENIRRLKLPDHE